MDLSEAIGIKYPQMLPYLSKVLILFTLYFTSARFGLGMDAASGFAALVWPPTGIALAALLLYGYRLWPGIALAALSVNFITGAPFLSAFGISVGNTLEAVVAAYVLNRHAGFHKSLDRIRDVVWFLLFAVILCTLISATLGVTSLWLGKSIASENIASAWYAWWRGDLYGSLIVAPLLLVWGTRSWPRMERRDAIEASSLILLMVAACLAVFGRFPATSVFQNLSLLFIFFPFIIWGSVRFAQIGNVTVTFLLSSFAIWGAAIGGGPFSAGSLSENLLLLNTYIGVLAVTGLILAASVTERKKALRALRESQLELQNAVKTRDEFISIASHELKSPLVLISLQLQRLRKAPSPDTLIPKIQNCESQASALCRLVDDLMDLTQIRMGKLDLQKEEMDLSRVAREVIEREIEPAEQAERVISLRAEAPVLGNWDRNRIEQVIRNLVSNAIKYGALSPIEISVKMDHERSVAKFEIKDYGIGVPLEMQNEIFECFKRADSGTAAKGLGLGLYVVRQIAEAHGGKVWIESQPHQGSTFTVELPTLAP